MGRNFSAFLSANSLSVLSAKMREVPFGSLHVLQRTGLYFIYN